jgi:uncharacterized protein with FMN-binding domain
MKKGVKILLISLVVIGAIILAGFIVINQMGGNPDDVNILGFDLTSIADGTYRGEYATTLVSAKVDVVVKDCSIIDIEIIEHEHGPNHSAEDITLDILKMQSIDVDVVSGSTMSSKVILKAVENALVE